jgi:hypothetical protein
VSSNPCEPVAVLSATDLRALVEEAVVRTLATRSHVYLDQAASAAHLGVSVRTFQSWQRKRIGPRPCILPAANGGRRGIHRWRVRDLDKWAAAHLERRAKGD